MNKSNHINLFVLITLVILLNLLSSFLNFNIDLTKDKIHSISFASKKIINELDDKIFIKIYLEGKFPAEFKHLQASTYDFLRKLKELSPSLIDFEFINPTILDERKKTTLFEQLVKDGLTPTDLEIRQMDSRMSQIIFPGAIIYYKDKNVAVNFLKNKITNNAGHNINASIENLE